MTTPRPPVTGDSRLQLREGRLYVYTADGQAVEVPSLQAAEEMLDAQDNQTHGRQGGGNHQGGSHFYSRRKR